MTRPNVSPQWRKSSHSGDTGGECVEVAAIPPQSASPDGEVSMTRPNAPAQWRKSSHSGAEGGDCVEVAGLRPAIGVSDSKNPHGPVLLLPAAQWQTLTRRIKAGQYDPA
ncbi:DUF397 domain-containing protein [Actinomadura viridis]|uniref:DUF397 domain-containing protein n=1 Tax=Actinomadura viridis TaxID=58110 RepID=UPI003696AD41